MLPILFSTEQLLRRDEVAQRADTHRRARHVDDHRPADQGVVSRLETLRFDDEIDGPALVTSPIATDELRI